jgi:N-methylhydantoinase B
MLNMIMPSVEEIEPRVPALILDREYVADTAGAGMHRGGAGLVKQSVFLAAGNHHLVPLHFRTPSGSGVCGGSDGNAGGAWWIAGESGDGCTEVPALPAASDFHAAIPVAGRVDSVSGRPDAQGEFAFFGREAVWQMERGAVLRWRTNGGGGWGDPFARDPQAVLRDVRDEYVSLAGARTDYGVSISGDPVNDPEGLTLDYAETERLRHAARPTPVAGPEPPRGAAAVRIDRSAVTGACPRCAADALAAYPVLSEGGWFNAVKCQQCLASVSREPDPVGPIVLRSGIV